MTKPRCLCFCLLTLSLLYSRNTSATHLRGGDITVSRPSCDGYQAVITLHVYTRVDPPAVTVSFGGGTLNFGDGTSLITQSRPNPPIIAQVDNGGVGDVEYPVTHTFPGPGTYTISYYEQNRNQGVLNMVNSVGTPFFIQAQITIDPLLGCDNSPVLLVPPIDEGCTGVTWTHNAGAYDPDGDSLSYSLYVPEQGAVYNANGIFVSAIPVMGYQSPNADVFYSSIGIPYAQANEAGNGTPIFSIDPVTGMITWDSPGEAGEYNIAFFITEWRKQSGQWQQLGYVERDMQIIIEDCKNKRPRLQLPNDTCVVAGALVKSLIIATDPDGSPTSGTGGIGDSLNIQAYSQVFGIGATYTPQASSANTIRQPTYSSTQQAQIRFSWQTDCSDVAQQPYSVLFKATDNGVPQLATFGTRTIRVVAPPPQLVSASIASGQQSTQLAWQSYSSSCNSVSSQSLMQIWRRVGSNPFALGTCVVGMPDSSGYALIAQVAINSTTYTDSNLAAGAEYCYRLVAVIRLPSGEYISSIASREMCTPPLLANAPILTNVTIDVTDSEAGQVTVKWRPPFQANKIQFPPPYTYQVLRSQNSSANSNLRIINSGKLTDSTFVDTGLNTSYTNIFYYRVLAFSANGNFMDSSAIASSVQLTVAPEYKKIQLTWKGTLPWSNNTAEYPMHLIYRGPNGATKISDLALIDSVNVKLNEFSYLDSGQYNASPLVGTQSYCYAVMTRGSYGNSMIKSPLINFSEISNSTSVITGDVPNQPGISLYPNPVESILQIVGIEGGVDWVQGFDVTGRSVSIFLMPNARGYEADVNSLVAGLYLVRVQAGTKILLFKFIKR